MVHKRHIATATIRFNILLKQQQKKNPTKKSTTVVIHFKKGHYAKIKILTKKNLKKVS